VRLYDIAGVRVQAKSATLKRMRTTAVLIVLAVAGCLAAAASGGRVAPQLRVVSRTPVTVAGSHFAARERVTVRIGADKAHVRVVRADAKGSFTVRFAVTSDICNDTLIVIATGATGDSARFKGNARACPPAP
jgi:hypothetical protein